MRSSPSLGSDFMTFTAASKLFPDAAGAGSGGVESEFPVGVAIFLYYVTFVLKRWGLLDVIKAVTCTFNEVLSKASFSAVWYISLSSRDSKQNETAAEIHRCFRSPPLLECSERHRRR